MSKRIGMISVFSKIYRLGNALYPELTASGLKHRLFLLATAAGCFSQVRNWYAIADNPWLTVARGRFPRIHAAIYQSYIHNNWSMNRRLATIDQHYRMLTGPAAIIAQAMLESIELARFAEYPGMRLILSKMAWFDREGEISLHLFVGEQRYLSATFTLGLDDAQPVILLGALQGSHSEDAQDVYRDMTHALYRMRPRDLLLVALKLFGWEIGVPRIWAISNAERHKVHANYDQIWQEHGGKELDNGFFELSTEVIHKPMSELPSRKRKAYRQRFEMLDRLALDIKAKCTSTTSPPASYQHPVASELPVMHDKMLAAN